MNKKRARKLRRIANRMNARRIRAIMGKVKYVG
jgi:hypothetical protein